MENDKLGDVFDTAILHNNSGASMVQSNSTAIALKEKLMTSVVEFIENPVQKEVCKTAP